MMVRRQSVGVLTSHSWIALYKFLSLAVVGLFVSQACTIWAASADHQLNWKTPRIFVHGANGVNCRQTSWVNPTTASVSLASQKVSMTAPGVLQDVGCIPRYYALSRDRAVSQSVVNAALQDVYPLHQPYVIGVKFHILSVASMTSTEESAVLDLVDTYVALAHAIFERNGVGLLISVNNHLVPLSGSSAIQSSVDMVTNVLIGAATPTDLLNSFKSLGPDTYDRGLINVYLFKGSEVLNNTVIANQFRAFHSQLSPVSFDDFIVINWQAANTASFAHEVGHALSLNHVNFVTSGGDMYCYAYGTIDGVCDYTDENLMWIEGEKSRSTLTPPQVLRGVLNDNSFVNKPGRFGGKPGIKLSCPDWMISPDCPFLGALQ